MLLSKGGVTFNRIDMLRVTLLGPLPVDGDSLGGAKVSFQTTCNIFKDRYCSQCRIINTSRPRSGANFPQTFILDSKAALLVFRQLQSAIPFTDVLFINMGAGALLKFGWAIARYARKRGARIILKPFGGDLFDVLERLPKLVRDFHLRNLEAVDLLCLQTHELVNKFEYLDNVFWLPNTREMPSAPRDIESSHLRRLIFLSHIRADKGVRHLLDASREFPHDVTLDFFGSLGFGITEDEINSFRGCKYRGEIKPEHVADSLSSYDALILPTFFAGEGYPGVVIEAFQMGLPVIVSDWKAIPEIVKHEENGILIATKSSSAIVKAVKQLYFDTELYLRLAQCASESGKLYSSTKVHQDLIARIEALGKRH